MNYMMRCSNSDIVRCLTLNEIEWVKWNVLLLQFKNRHVLVTWLRAVAEELHLNNASVHLAVYLLDIFMDNHRIVEERLNLVALVCILLAGLYIWLMITTLYIFHTCNTYLYLCLKHWISVPQSCCSQY
jgi:hypothetical protein